MTMCSCSNETYYDQNQIHFLVSAFEHLGITALPDKFIKTLK